MIGERQRAERDTVNESAIAQRIWRSVVPEILEPVPEYRCTLLSCPAASVGGDFHLATEDGWIAVGDVSGKGLPAAILTGMFVSALRLAVRTAHPAVALDDAVGRELERAGMFASLVAARLGPDGRVDILNAGHPPALVVHQEGDHEWVPAAGPPVGVVRGRDIRPVSIQLLPGDVLVLYSDGVTDAERGGRRFGTDGVLSTMPAWSRDGTVAPLQAALEGWRKVDDVTAIVAVYDPGSGALDSLLDRR